MALPYRTRSSEEDLDLPAQAASNMPSTIELPDRTKQKSSPYAQDVEPLPASQMNALVQGNQHSDMGMETGTDASESDESEETDNGHEEEAVIDTRSAKQKRNARGKKKYRQSRKRALVESLKKTGKPPKKSPEEKRRIAIKRDKRAARELRVEKKNNKRIMQLESQLENFNESRKGGKRYLSRTVVANRLKEQELQLRLAVKSGETTVELAQDDLAGIQKRYRLLDENTIINHQDARHDSVHDVMRELEWAVGMEVIRMREDYTEGPAKFGKDGKPTIFNRPSH